MPTPYQTDVCQMPQYIQTGATDKIYALFDLSAQSQVYNIKRFMQPAPEPSLNLDILYQTVICYRGSYTSYYIMIYYSHLIA